uniref:methyltransferase domain-containing protein n=1 Tax=Pedobacter schmidteae TaxID=2201271 RepID=UPI0013CE5E54|nr:methyltransferase domain-containing protein [Pedobacter schmidteae]
MPQLITGEVQITLNYKDDDAFDAYFSQKIQKVSKVHWTPLQVAKKAAEFLAPHPGCKIIDIGSGPGKFCIAAAYHHPDSEFHGIEQREQLHRSAIHLKTLIGMDNVHFMHGDFTELSMAEYTGFYFFNSFAENLYTFGRIDSTISHSVSLYNYYSNYFHKILEQKPSGTRLASYHAFENEFPDSYQLHSTYFKNNLKLWIKR